jgi:hypothetical protein
MHTEPVATRRVEGSVELVIRIRGEFMEMPGLRLTPAQAQKMWALDLTTCVALLGTLVDHGFLFQTRDGAFMRLDPSTTARSSLNARTESRAVA